MDEKNFDSDIILKTSLMGFDKKSVMDYIEKLEQEKEDYRRKCSELETELAVKDAEIESLKSDPMDDMPMEAEEAEAFVERAKMYVPFEDDNDKANTAAASKKPVIKAHKAPTKVHIKINSK